MACPASTCYGAGVAGSDLLLVCGALQWEVRPVLRALRKVERWRDAPAPGWRGHMRDVGLAMAVCRLGMGPERAGAVTARLLDEIPASMVIVTGCAGALRDDLDTGAVVVADRVLTTDGASPLLMDSRWSDVLATAGGGRKVTRGAVVTSPTVLATAAEKYAAARRYGAVAVDMETAAIATIAQRRGIPVACARVILDRADSELPQIDGLADEAGNVKPARALSHVIKHPASARALVSLGVATRVAEKVLEHLFARIPLILASAPQPN